MSWTAASGRRPAPWEDPATAAWPTIAAWKDLTVTIRIPDEIKPADGRFGCGPCKVRPEAVEALAGVATTLPRHVPPAEDGRTRSPGCAAASPSSSRLPDGYEVILRNGGTTAFWEVGHVRADPRPGPVRHVRRVRRQVRQGRQGRAVPRRADGPQGRAGHAPRPWSPRPASTRTAPRTTRPRPASPCRSGGWPAPTTGALLLHRRHLGRRRPRGRPDARPTSTTSRRRRRSAPTAACGSR